MPLKAAITYVQFISKSEILVFHTIKLALVSAYCNQTIVSHDFIFNDMVVQVKLQKTTIAENYNILTQVSSKFISGLLFIFFSSHVSNGQDIMTHGDYRLFYGGRRYSYLFALSLTWLEP
ncbi:hypothetical protein CHS0354_028733 [Potamilus streckersoni]|uniref:Uncharacterized protein n=1 Tax=Potamilus streckersoni TaxID=2493646 RepID=A0AAE0S8T4_9BIVA|nr:hypothetical protein CHS0354_028733 [Potamilus streckersoni]